MSEGRPEREAGHWDWRGGTFEDLQEVALRTVGCSEAS